MSGKNKTLQSASTQDHGRPEDAGGVHVALAGASLTGGRRVDPPGQEDNEHSHRPDTPPGLEHHHGDDDAPGQTITGTDMGETLTGGAGSDSITAGLGDDTLDGAGGADTLSGGGGNDTFVIRAASGSGADDHDDDHGHHDEHDDHDDDDHDGAHGLQAGSLDHVIDFTHGQDHLEFGGPAATAANFNTAMATDFAGALAAATTANAGGAAYVAVQVGADVIVFADVDGVAGVDSAVVLVGKTLADVSIGDFV